MMDDPELFETVSMCDSGGYDSDMPALGIRVEQEVAISYDTRLSEVSPMPNLKPSASTYLPLVPRRVDYMQICLQISLVR